MVQTLNPIPKILEVTPTEETVLGYDLLDSYRLALVSSDMPHIIIDATIHLLLCDLDKAGLIKLTPYNLNGIRGTALTIRKV